METLFLITLFFEIALIIVFIFLARYHLESIKRMIKLQRLICPKCGQRIDLNFGFCNQCGSLQS
ncbi:MAG: zinc-ribbon domain-containing protein [Candidatus Hodarchaeota archaeon]